MRKIILIGTLTLLSLLMISSFADAAAPGVFHLSTPTNGSSISNLGGNVNVSCNTSTNAVKYAFRINGVLKQNTSAKYYIWTVSGLEGSYTLNVTCYNATGVRRYSTGNFIVTLYYPLPSEQAGAIGIMARAILDLVLIFIGIALVYVIINDYMKKKKKTYADTVDMFITVIITTVAIGLCAAFVAMF